MTKWAQILFFSLILALGLRPAFADVALPAAALFMGGLAYTYPILLGVVLLETLIFWFFWGRPNAYSFIASLGRVTLINLISTLLGLLGMLFSESLEFVAFVVYFVLTLLVEGWLWVAFFHKHFDDFSSRAPIRATLAMNIPSYLLLFGVVLFVGGNKQAERRYQEYAQSQLYIRHSMTRLQSIIETYAVDYDGLYPESTALITHYLSQDPSLTNMQEDFVELEQELQINTLKQASDSAQPRSLSYIPLPNENGEISGYMLYGYDRQGNALRHAGSWHVLSNS